MPDREKVIAWLNEIVNTLGSFTDDSEQEVCQLAKDTLALLKEQEAVKPTKSWYLNELSMAMDIYRCGNCNEEITGKGKYCSNCGKPILWKGR